MIFSRPSNAPPQMNRNIGGIHLDEFLVRVLAATLRRYRCYRTFDQLQQGLLYAFTRDITGNRRVFRLAGNLVDFVQVHNAALGFVHIVVALLQELLDDVLNVLAYVTGFGQCGSVSNDKRHIQQPGQCLCQQRLAGAGRADQQDVALGQLYVVLGAGRVEAFVVVVHRHGQRFLGRVLANDVLVQRGADFLRCRQGWCFALLVCSTDFRFCFVANDVAAQIYTLIANVDLRAGDQSLHFVLAFAAKRAVQQLVLTAFICHQIDIPN